MFIKFASADIAMNLMKLTKYLTAVTIAISKYDRLIDPFKI